MAFCCSAVRTPSATRGVVPVAVIGVVRKPSVIVVVEVVEVVDVVDVVDVVVVESPQHSRVTRLQQLPFASIYGLSPYFLSIMQQP